MEELNWARDGEGLWACVELHQWFTKTTLQGQTNKRLTIMQPIAPKHDHEVVGTVELRRAIQDDDGGGWRRRTPGEI